MDDDDENDKIDNDDDENDEIDNEAAIVENIAIVDNVNNLELELEIELEEMAGVNFEDVAEEEEAAEVAEEVVEVIEDVAIENEDEVEIDEDEIEDDEKEIDVNARMDALYGPRTGRNHLRARKARDYGHLHATTLESTAMTQHRCARPFILMHSSRFTSLSYCPAQHVDALAGPSQNSNESFVASTPLFGPGRKVDLHFQSAHDKDRIGSSVLRKKVSYRRAWRQIDCPPWQQLYITERRLNSVSSITTNLTR